MLQECFNNILIAAHHISGLVFYTAAILNEFCHFGWQDTSVTAMERADLVDDAHLLLL